MDGTVKAKSWQDFLENLATGGVAATVAKTIVAPMDRLKILMQLQAGNSILSTAKTVWTEQGVWSFWRGNGTNVLRYFPTQALNFAFKDEYRNLLVGHKIATTMNPNYNHDFIYSFIAGGLAGGTTELFVYPLDFVRTRLTADMAKSHSERTYHSISHCITTVVQNEGGIRALYRGLGVTIAGIIPYRACYFGGYDFLKKKYLQAPSQHGGPSSSPPSFLALWTISQVNTIASQYLIYPLDTIRRKMIVHGGGEHKHYENSFHCAQQIYTKQGLIGFYRGSGANALRATGGALCMAFYDYLKSWIITIKAQHNHK